MSLDDSIHEAAKLLEGGFTNPCEAGHSAHDELVVTVDEHDFYIYAWKEYANSVGYCPGDDAVSQSIDVTGNWEPHITRLFDDILDDEHGVVVDIGAHFGWYTVRALNRGCRTISIEPNEEVLATLVASASNTEHPHLLTPVRGWIDKDPLQVPVFPIRLMKIDIEGNEQYAIEAFDRHFAEHKVDYLIMEVSPIFNDSYGPLLKQLIMDGYRCWKIGAGNEPDVEWTYATVDEELEKINQCDVVFQSPVLERSLL